MKFVHVGDICECQLCYVFEVPDVDIIRPFVELLFLLCFIASWTCVVVSVIEVVCSLCVFLSICPFVLCVLCLTVLVIFC